MTIDILRKSIREPIENEAEERELWRYYDTVNCYSYAMGIFYDFYHLTPGKISGFPKKRQYTDEDILQRVVSDINFLGMKIRKSYLEEVVESATSWKIAILNTGVRTIEEIYDYHFLRQSPNKNWYQKHPNEQFITQYDARNHIIIDPETAQYSHPYHLVGYYVVSKVEQS